MFVIKMMNGERRRINQETQGNLTTKCPNISGVFLFSKDAFRLIIDATETIWKARKHGFYHASKESEII